MPKMYSTFLRMQPRSRKLLVLSEIFFPSYASVPLNLERYWFGPSALTWDPTNFNACVTKVYVVFVLDERLDFFRDLFRL